MTKGSYVEAKNKRTLQKEVYRYFIESGNDKIVGLAGPSVVDYCNYLRNCGFKKIRVYENDIKVLKKVARELPKLRKSTEFVFGDIFYDRIKKNTVYDLDFCCTMRTIGKHVSKFRENFILTVSLRRCSLKDTMQLFAQYREEKTWLVGGLEDPNRSILQTDKGLYMFIKYRDTSNMCMIYKLREK